MDGETELKELNIKEEIQDYDEDEDANDEEVEYDIKPIIVPKLIKREVDQDNLDYDIVDEEEYEDEEGPYDEQDLESSDDDDGEFSENDSDSDYKGSKTKRRASKKADFLCLGCDRTFKSQPNLNKHLGHFSGCKQFYEDSGNLPNCFSHPKKKASGDNGDFQCEKCKKKFASEGGLNRHVAKIKVCKRYYDKINGVDDINTDGLTARQSYYKRNREKVIARQREYYQRNANKVKERRVQHYRTKAVQNQGADEQHIPIFQKSTAYLERHKEYYEKNRETIKERRRNYYHMKKEALCKKVGKYEFAKITAMKNLAEIPDPFEAHGNVEIHIPTPLPPIQALNKLPDNRKKIQESDDETNDHVTETNTSPLETCLDYGLAAKPGDSKLDLIDSEEEDLVTMPDGTVLSSTPFDYNQVQNVEAIIGLTLAKDSECLEVCPLLEKNDIKLSSIRKLIHAVMSVLSIDFKAFVQEKSCPVHLFEVKHMHLLKDKLTRDLMKVDNVLPELTSPICNPLPSTESDFLDEESEIEIPAEQLLVNENLVSSDLGAVAVQWRHPDSPDEIRINPLFSINSIEHWRLKLRHFYTLLVNWVGGKIVLNQIFHLLPCMITAKESFFDEVRADCHRELLKPLETKICEHCGEVFQFSKYTLQTRRAYARHVQLHDHNCKICGETFPNGTQRKFHERSHKAHSVNCPHENCHYVGSSQQAVDTHIKHAHSTLVCDLCGKVTVAQNLKLHMATHHAPKTFEFICSVCGKGYSTKNILDKHMKRHNNPDSLINKWMAEPNEFKFECKEHENCKRYFKSEKRLKEHLRRYGGKSYPANLARQYVPNLPENHSTIVDSTNIQMDSSKKLERIKAGKHSRIQNGESSKPFKKRKKESDDEELKDPANEYQPPFQQFYQHLYPGNIMTPQEMYNRSFKSFQDADSNSSSQQNY